MKTKKGSILLGSAALLVLLTPAMIFLVTGPRGGAELTRANDSVTESVRALVPRSGIEIDWNKNPDAAALSATPPVYLFRGRSKTVAPVIKLRNDLQRSPQLSDYTLEFVPPVVKENTVTFFFILTSKRLFGQAIPQSARSLNWPQSPPISMPMNSRIGAEKILNRFVPRQSPIFAG